MVMLRDPDWVKKHAKRGDPPIALWPGAPRPKLHLAEASGDGRDWFRYGHRLGKWERYWMEFVDARQRRHNFHAGFEWNQILIIGDYGDGKTAAANKRILENFRRGHPAFFNASFLVGWLLHRDKIYTAMGFMPTSSTLAIDESSGALAGVVGHNVAVSSFNQMNLNTRKKNCQVIYISAHDWEIAPSIRRNCKEVWKPVPKDDLIVDSPPSTAGYIPHAPLTRTVQRPADNPANFRMAYYVWDGYPYRKGNLIEGRDKHNEGFGPPDRIVYDEGENVRDALILNDTFELAASGAARVADPDAVKGDLVAYLDGDAPTAQAGGGGGMRHDEQQEQILLMLQSCESNPPEYIRAGDIERETGISSSLAGRLMQAMFPVKPVRNKGYSTEAIFGYLDEIEMELEA